MTADPFQAFVRRSGLLDRPALGALGKRGAPPLHRTLPTWAREPKGELVEWRLYAPSHGAALFTAVTMPADGSRLEAAARLRVARGVIWGRDKARGLVPGTPNPVDALRELLERDGQAVDVPSFAAAAAALEAPADPLPQAGDAPPMQWQLF